jgi:hypothetical protein
MVKTCYSSDWLRLISLDGLSSLYGVFLVFVWWLSRIYATKQIPYKHEENTGQIRNKYLTAEHCRSYITVIPRDYPSFPFPLIF